MARGTGAIICPYCGDPFEESYYYNRHVLCPYEKPKPAGMTEEQILSRMTGAQIGHPAWSKFVAEMADKQYGHDALIQAWYFFREGYDAHGS